MDREKLNQIYKVQTLYFKNVNRLNTLEAIEEYTTHSYEKGGPDTSSEMTDLLGTIVGMTGDMKLTLMPKIYRRCYEAIVKCCEDEKKSLERDIKLADDYLDKV